LIQPVANLAEISSLYWQK